MNKTFALLCAALLASACTPKLVEQLPYYKLPVIQGIPLDVEAVAALKPGMTREQVQLTVGAPLLNSVFRNDRWDYTYEVVRGGKVKETKTLTVYFQGNMVSRIEGSALDEIQRNRQEATQ
ncbi:outer membrane protein assembly factor BamE [Conchiformibius steedae DSM 2580]|uniref:Outer membrane protein assembly factor BamE n=1 Tax=Conchiformibius steedae DSM 2580 TaxID=1121352 RepID=A0AAE9KXQ4_9NEIS|nr:outer membrane protein assembly factor BamE [Conchiformibius steedae]QMT33928.1 outer membrane protein assembly factor BamE [Conchiformibius steedae]URD66697.1 outer membrane protein assembly factor BamE [Conchiformibius steedae DSM 2580]